MSGFECCSYGVLLILATIVFTIFMAWRDHWKNLEWKERRVCMECSKIRDSTYGIDGCCPGCGGDLTYKICCRKNNVVEIRIDLKEDDVDINNLFGEEGRVRL